MTMALPVGGGVGSATERRSWRGARSSRNGLISTRCVLGGMPHLEIRMARGVHVHRVAKGSAGSTATLAGVSV